MKKVLFTATVDSHILAFHTPYLKYFKDKGYEVHVATNGTEKIPFTDVRHTVSFERSPFKPNNLKAMLQLKKIIDNEKFEIIHTHTPMGSAVTRIAATEARKKHATRVIYTAHGFHFYKGAPKLNWIIFYPVEKMLARKTDTLITINKEDYTLAKKKFKTDVQYVPGVGIDPKKFDFKMSKSQKTTLRESLGLKDSDFVLIFPAELSKRKRQIWLIRALADLIKEKPEIHLLLPGVDSLRGACQKLTNELELRENIHFLGFRKDIPQLLKISDVAVSSSRQEGLPVNIIEAMYLGLPVISTNCRGNRDLIEEYKAGFIYEKEDHDRLVEYVNMLLASRKTAQNYVSTDKQSDKYLLDQVMEEINAKIYRKKRIALIIPTCTDFNRGDQALVLETKRIIKDALPECEVYLMSSGETKQMQSEGIKIFKDILKHPSRFGNNKSNITYGFKLRTYWGVIAIYDLVNSLLILNRFTRKIFYHFFTSETKKSIRLYENCNFVFVKGGGFLHDYSGGLVGLYTMYFQTYHIRLATRMNKKIYIMPNSYGPFKNNYTAKMLNRILNKCEIVTARESISSDATKNGLQRDIERYPDLAFYLETKSNNRVNEHYKKLHLSTTQNCVVAITVRPYRFYGYENPEKKYYEYKQTFVKFIEYLQANKIVALLVVHTRAENDHENDERCIDEIFTMLKSHKDVHKISNNNFNCYDIKNVYSNCSYVVGTRFHSVIFSLQQSIPCLAVTYGGHKGDGIMDDLGLPEYAIQIGELNSEILISKFEMLVKNSVKTKDNISAYLNSASRDRTSLIKSISDTDINT